MDNNIPKSIPSEIKKFNFGALLLNVIWGIRHGVWISLLTFIPVIGWIGMPILLGFKGNEWAWRKNNYISTSQFLKSQRQWAIAGLVIYLSIPLTFFYMLNYSDSVKTVLSILNSNEQVTSYLGDSIHKDTYFGSISRESIYYAPSHVEINSDFKVRGSKRAGIAKLKFRIEDNQIVMDELIIADEKNNIVIEG